MHYAEITLRLDILEIADPSIEQCCFSNLVGDAFSERLQDLNELLVILEGSDPLLPDRMV